MHALMELTGAAGLGAPAEIGPHLIRRRISRDRVVRLDELHPAVAPGSLLDGSAPAPLREAWNAADAETFDAAEGSVV